MELSILLAEQIFSLLLMVLTGYVVRKLNVVPKCGRKVLASIVLYVSAPCIVFDSFQIEYSSEKLFGLVVGFAAACIALAVFCHHSLIFLYVCLFRFAQSCFSDIYLLD